MITLFHSKYLCPPSTTQRYYKKTEQEVKRDDDVIIKLGQNKTTTIRKEKK